MPAQSRPRSGPQSGPSDPPDPVLRTSGHEGPHFGDFVPKATRLPAEDLEALTLLARRLERQRQASRDRGTKQPRITENTMIRLGVRLLLQHADRLAGATEDELWASLID